MTNSKNTKKALFTSFLSLLLCVSMLIGTTFAWFTDNVSSVNNIIQAGNLDVELYYQNDETSDWTAVSTTSNVFKEGALWEPGHTEVVYLKVKNAGTLALKYQLSINVASEKGSTNVEGNPFLLSSYIQYAAVLDCKDQFDSRDDARKEVADAPIRYLYQAFVKEDILLKAGEEAYLAFVVYMPEEVGNEANHAKDADAPYINLGINLMATQYTYEDDSYGNDYDAAATYWDGKADTTWYDPDAVVYELSTPYQLAGLRMLVDDGVTFEGKTVRLAADIDLYVVDENGDPICFDPIGSYRKNTPFKGTFDGQGHTISNLNQNTWALNNGYYYGDLGLGLFGKVEDATIKNLVMDKASISGESAIVGIVAGCAYGDMVFENITVKNSQGADYQYYAGGIVGWASGNHQYINCNVDETTTIGSQWGDFGNASGGIIGGAGSSGTYYMKDCTVACRIDAVNDVVSAYQWYNYRNCGMLIGKTGHTATSEAVTSAAAPNLICENVTVIYGEWANYTYCEFAGTGYPYVRVQAGTSVDAYSNVRYGHPTDANGNTVIDDNHVHNAGEDHQILIVFDQLYGGNAGPRYCEYGVATHDGVKVVYKAPATADQVFEEINAFDKSGNKGSVTLNADYKTSESESRWSSNREYALRDAGTDLTLNLNGHTVTHDTDYQNGKNTGYTYLFTTAYNGKLTVNGDGKIHSENKDGLTCIFYAQGPSEVVINCGDYYAVRGVPVWAGNGAKVTINGGNFTSSGSNDEELIYSSGGVIDIYGGFFHNEGWENRPVNVANANRGTGFINIYGGTFVNFDPSTGGDDPSNILIADGYKVVSETQANGDIWYTVVPE